MPRRPDAGAVWSIPAAAEPDFLPGPFAVECCRLVFCAVSTRTLDSRAGSPADCYLGTAICQHRAVSALWRLGRGRNRIDVCRCGYPQSGLRAGCVDAR
ncbi:hypothetical protein D9M71_687000 [compost metagenome]